MHFSLLLILCLLLNSPSIFWEMINACKKVWNLFFMLSSTEISTKVKLLFVMHFYIKFEKYKNSVRYMNIEFSGKILEFSKLILDIFTKKYLMVIELTPWFKNNKINNKIMVPLSGCNPWTRSREESRWIRNYPIEEGLSEFKLRKKIILEQISLCFLTLKKSKIAFPEKSCIVTESIHVDEVVREMLEYLGLEISGVEVDVAGFTKLIPDGFRVSYSIFNSLFY